MEETVQHKTCCPTIGRALKCEFKCWKFGFTGANYSLFPLSTWVWMDGFIYPFYRFLVCLGLVAWAAVEIPIEVIRSETLKIRLTYFLYATNWAFLSYTVTSVIFSVFCAVFNACKDRRVPKWLAELLWFLYGMSMNTVLVTSLVYWFALADPNYSEFYRPESKLKHILPAVTVFLDAWLNGLPIRLFHALYPLLLGFLYAIFSYIYYSFGDKDPIYPVLDWGMPIKALVASALTITFSLVAQSFLYLIFLARTMLSYRLGGRGGLIVEEWWSYSCKAKAPVEEPATEVEVENGHDVDLEAVKACDWMSSLSSQNSSVLP